MSEMKVTTENPTPPVGLQANEIFTVDTALQPQTEELNLIREMIPNIRPAKDIYLETLEIPLTLGPRQRVGNSGMSSVNPLDDKYRIKYGGEQGLVKYFCPWALIPLHLSALAQLDFDLVYRPIKVNDCRVSLDFLYKYSGTYVGDVITANDYQRDTITINIDDVEEEFIIPMNMYYLFPNISTRAYINNSYVEPEVLKTAPDAFIPVVAFRAYIKNPYQPSSIQPDKMKLQVWLRPRISNIQKLCSPTYTQATYVPSETPVTTYMYSPPWPFNLQI